MDTLEHKNKTISLDNYHQDTFGNFARINLDQLATKEEKELVVKVRKAHKEWALSKLDKGELLLNGVAPDFISESWSIYYNNAYVWWIQYSVVRLSSHWWNPTNTRTVWPLDWKYYKWKHIFGVINLEDFKDIDSAISWQDSLWITDKVKGSLRRVADKDLKSDLIWREVERETDEVFK